jgi:cytochrome d ubiquinol oxidase subunit I
VVAEVVRDERYNQAARFWSRIFAASFIMGVVTGIPMEFQFGTNWARFSAATGSIIAQMLVVHSDPHMRGHLEARPTRGH